MGVDNGDIVVEVDVDKEGFVLGGFVLGGFVLGAFLLLSLISLMSSSLFNFPGRYNANKRHINEISTTTVNNI